MISRFRSERRRGRDKLAAIEVASSTAGRAVFFSGLAVVVSLSGLLLLNDTLFHSMALGTIAGGGGVGRRQPDVPAGGAEHPRPRRRLGADPVLRARPPGGHRVLEPHRPAGDAAAGHLGGPRPSCCCCSARRCCTCGWARPTSPRSPTPSRAWRPSSSSSRPSPRGRRSRSTCTSPPPTAPDVPGDPRLKDGRAPAAGPEPGPRPSATRHDGTVAPWSRSP